MFCAKIETTSTRVQDAGGRMDTFFLVLFSKTVGEYLESVLLQVVEGSGFFWADASVG